LAVLLGPDKRSYLVCQATPEQEKKSILRRVWKDGAFRVFENFKTIRERALLSLENIPA